MDQSHAEPVGGGGVSSFFNRFEISASAVADGLVNRFEAWVMDEEEEEGAAGGGTPPELRPCSAPTPTLVLAAAPAAEAIVPLPAGWERHITPDGTPYYIDHNTQRTSWEPPGAATPPSYAKPEPKPKAVVESEPERMPEPEPKPEPEPEPEAVMVRTIRPSP